MNEIKELQVSKTERLLKIYKKRLEEIKKAIIELAKSGGNTRVFMAQKKRLEKLIKTLQGEFDDFSEEVIEESYEAGKEEQRKRLGALDIALIGLWALRDTQEKTLKNVLKTHLSRITGEVSKKVTAYVRTDFSNPKATAKALNNITDTGILSSKVEPAQWQNLMKGIEKRLKDKDIFHIPYRNKNGDVIRRVKASTYAEMLARTLTANIFREAAKDSILKNFGEFGDLVEIIGRSIYPNSPCIPYEGQVLSLAGQTKGYTTIEDAKSRGLFHPNCIHWFSVTNNIVSIYNKEYPIIEHFSKANILAREAKEAVFEKGMKKGKLEEKAVKYLYNKIPKERKRGDFIVGEMNSTAKQMLSVSTSKVRLSLESLAKNAIKHYDMLVEDYSRIGNILKNPDAIIPQRDNHIKYRKKINNEIYSFILKATTDKNEVYLISYRKDKHI